MTFGTRLREARSDLELSQEQLGARLGVTKTTISAWESDAKLPEASRLPDLRRVYRRSIDWLFGFEERSLLWHAPEVGKTVKISETAGHYPTQEDLRILGLMAKLSDKKQHALFDLLSDDEGP